MPAGDVDRFGRSRQSVGSLVQDVFVPGPGWNIVAGIDRALQSIGDVVKVLAQVRLDRRNRVEAQEALVPIMQQLAQCLPAGERLVWLHLLAQHQHQEAVLRD